MINHMNLTKFRSQISRRQIALPQDHGSWVFLLSPLLIGLFAGENLNYGSIILIFAALSGFLIRQPITILIKIYSGRRNRRDLPAAQFWSTVYAATGLIAVVLLIYLGYGFVLYLAVPGILVFSWHLYLVSRRSERRQAGVEIAASGVLALAAPAAYWIEINGYNPTGWWLFILTWFQSAASIVYAYLRLEQRQLSGPINLKTKLILGRRAIIYTSFNLVTVAIFSFSGRLPSFLPLPYLIQWAETIWGTIYPAIGFKPTQIGIRQLIVSTIFTVTFIITWQI
jgi:hypothetical protein